MRRRPWTFGFDKTSISAVVLVAIATSGAAAAAADTPGAAEPSHAPAILGEIDLVEGIAPELGGAPVQRRRGLDLAIPAQLVAAAGTRPRSVQTAQTPPEAPDTEPRKAVESVVPAISERAGVLTAPGVLVFEPSVEYSHYSQNRILIEGFSVFPAITIGNIDVRRVNRNAVTAAATARLGLLDWLEMDVKVPWLYRSQSTTARALGEGASFDTVTDVNGNGLGDVEFGAHVQLTDGRGGWPFLIGNVKAKAPTGKDPFEVGVTAQGLESELPTGSGFWGVEPSLTILASSDPVVYWGNFGYLFNLERTVASFGTIDPGDAVRTSIGMGIAVSEKASFSLGYEHSFVFRSTQNGIRIDGSDLQIGSLLLGTSYRLSDTSSINVTLNVGVTEDSPDVRILVRVPLAFDLFAD